MSDGISLAGTYTWSKMIEEKAAATQIDGNTFVDNQLLNLQRSNVLRAIDVIA